jgi:hypothetical protein
LPQVRDHRHALYTRIPLETRVGAVNPRMARPLLASFARTTF